MVFGGKFRLLFFFFNFDMLEILLSLFRYLVGFKNLLKSIECQNIASSFGIKYYGRGYLSSDGFVSFIRYEFLARELINSTLNYVPRLTSMYKNITKTLKYKKMKRM